METRTRTHRLPLMAALLPLAVLALPQAARAQVYRCETESGVPLYQNTPGGRNCKAMNLQPLTTIPAPALPAPAGTPSVPPLPRSASPASPAAANPTPAGYPRVDAATQKARDSDRRRIIEDELRREEQKLADLRREFNNGEPERRGDERNYQKYLDRVAQMKDELARSEGAVASLRRELGALRD